MSQKKPTPAADLVDVDLEFLDNGPTPAHTPGIGLHLAGPFPAVLGHVRSREADTTLVAGVVAREGDPGSQTLGALLTLDGIDA